MNGIAWWRLSFREAAAKVAAAGGGGGGGGSRGSGVGQCVGWYAEWQ